MTDTSLVPVSVPCDCPEQFRHADGDVVSLFPRLGLEAGIAVQSAFDANASPEQRLIHMRIALIDHQIAAWTKVDAEGKPADHRNPAIVRARLSWLEGGSEIVAKMTELYGAAILAPFVNSTRALRQMKGSPRTSGSSEPGQPAARSTSRTRAGKGKRRAH